MPQPTQPELGVLVRAARARARMSRATLARHAGLSPSTIANIEAGRDISLPSLRAVVAVRELALPETVVSPLVPDRPLPNAWYAPGFAPVAEFRRMLAILTGAGGSLEQTFLYADLPAAMDWCHIAAQPDYAEAHRALPLDRAAHAIVRSARGLGLDLIALGPGTGVIETRLCALTAQLLPHPAIRFYLLDISLPLLGEAFCHAAHALSPYQGITPIAIAGDFHALPQYSQLFYAVPAAPRRQVVCMLGGTFANLDHELRFHLAPRWHLHPRAARRVISDGLRAET